MNCHEQFLLTRKTATSRKRWSPKKQRCCSCQVWMFQWCTILCGEMRHEFIFFAKLQQNQSLILTVKHKGASVMVWGWFLRLRAWTLHNCWGTNGFLSWLSKFNSRISGHLGNNDPRRRTEPQKLNFVKKKCGQVRFLKLKLIHYDIMTRKASCFVTS